MTFGPSIQPQQNWQVHDVEKGVWMPDQAFKNSQPFYPVEMEMQIVSPQSWGNQEDATVSYYEAEMRRIELEKSELRRQGSLRKEEVTPEALKAVLEAGMDRFLQHVKKQLPPEAQSLYEIRFQNFSYTATLEERKVSMVTIGTQLKSLLSPFSTKTKIERKVLNDLSGIIKAGKMTLVLGLPGSGKSSFLKALSGVLHVDENSVKSGNLIYNGEINAGNLDLRRLCKYVEQRECHLPSLTVRETLQFARSCLASNRSPLGPDYDHLHDIKLQSILLSLGLAHAADTPVGDEKIRGISGGEKRRLTLAEMMMSDAKIFCLDEITTGLDSSSAFDIVSSLRQLAHNLDTTLVISLLQPLPDTFGLFDEVVLLADGQIAFHGPIPQALQHFRSLGFEQHRRTDDADYLLQCVSEADKIYRGGPLGTVPPTPAVLAQVWRKTAAFESQLEALRQPSPFPPASGDLAQELYGKPYALSFWTQTRLCLSRQALLMRRNLPFLQARIGQAVLLGLMSGSLFYNIQPDNFQQRFAYLFFILITLALNHMSGIPIIIAEKDVFSKQRLQNFMGVPQFIVSAITVQIPLIIVECIIFNAFAYWMSGLSRTAGGTHFLIFVLVTVLTSMVMCAVFLAICYASPNLQSAQTYGGLYTVLTIVFAGFMIAQSEIPSWWIWLHYLTPMSWSLRTVAINECLSSNFESPVPTDPSRTLGELYLDIFGFKTEKIWVLYGIIALIFQFFLYVFLGGVALYRSKLNIPNRVVVRKTDTVSLGAEVPRSIPAAVLKFIPATLSFHDISYTVSQKGENLTLLSGVYGYALPGTMTALMGSSGAGKTTLLDVLAGRKTSGKIEGQILVNGFPKDSTFSRVCGYCEQTDIHTRTATVHEALLYSARLRLEAPSAEISNFVDNVMNILQLQPIAKNVVENLTTEQAKRLTIGVELTANPSILFLDEPTSGLDARAAGIVMAAIKNVAATGRTVVCTIHQPSSEIFENFDRVLLLRRGGETAYFGPLGPNSESLINYFRSIPGTRPYVDNQNPASYMLDAIGAGVGNTTSADFATEYKRSALSRENDAVLEHVLRNVNPAERVTFARQYARSYWTQFIACLAKNFNSYWRMPEYNLVRTLFLTVVAVIFGSLYYDNDPTTRKGAFSRLSSMFITTLFIGFVHLNTIIGVAFAERAVFYREKAAGTFNAVVYSVAAGLVEIPYQIFNSFCFCVIFYYMVGLKTTVAGFFFYHINFFLFTLLCTDFGQFLAVSLPTVEVASVLAPVGISIWNLFCGYVIQKKDIADGYIWLYWLSPFHYLVENLVSDQFHCDDSVDCFSVEVTLPSGENVNVPSDDFVKDSFSMYHRNRDLNLMALFLFVFFFRAVTAVLLSRINHSKR